MEFGKIRIKKCIIDLLLVSVLTRISWLVKFLLLYASRKKEVTRVHTEAHSCHSRKKIILSSILIFKGKCLVIMGKQEKVLVLVNLCADTA